MVSPEEAKAIALSFDGTDEKPHFHRTAFTVNKKIFATLLAGDSTLNLMFDLQTQFIFCPPESDVIYPVPNKWGLKGATTINLKKANKKLVMSGLKEAYNLRLMKK
ncbi:MmcQ/YjbR family DNA-binding protein [Parafilimonas sp.]|uniref:MmcQ/YjbR family DNA-binding protein n=1 Tax=Parafilimonas sp. TaxID=1969739 RepID=UPI0039E59B77